MNQLKSNNKSVCRYLKSKNSFGMLEGGDNKWFGIEDSNATYWCNKTAGAMGPDNGFVGPKMCVEGRKCYQSQY